MFGQVVKLVLGFLGLSVFMKDQDGKSVLSSDQEKQLREKYGDMFVNAFKKDLADFEKDGASAESAVTPEVSAALNQQIQKDAETIKTLRADIDVLKKNIDAMQKEPAGDSAQLLGNKNNGEAMKEFKPDMSLAINKAYVAAAEGAGYQYNGNDTVDTTELRTEFDRYVSHEKLEIFKKLLAPTNSVNYMSTIITDKFQYRASQAQIGSVLQAFVPKWTPKGKSKFTPLTIESYPCKINVPIIPADVMNDIIGYLYDENLSPKDMPIVRYIVEQLIKPKLTEDREVAISTGRYVEPTAGEMGKWEAGEAKGAMTGYLTQLCDLKKASDADVNWLLSSKTGSGLGEGKTLLDNIDAAVDEVKPVYKNQKLTIHADPDLILKYSRAYRSQYPNTKNEDGEMVKVDFTNFTFAGLEGMRGTGAFFITPKDNFKHILSRDPKSMKIRMQEADYEVKIFGEWREGTGFLIKEAIAAFIPDALVTKLAPEVMAASAETNEGGI